VAVADRGRPGRDPGRRTAPAAAAAGAPPTAPAAPAQVASLTAPMIMPAKTNTTIAIWIQSQERGTATAF
jgi:hypothetical protein